MLEPRKAEKREPQKVCQKVYQTAALSVVMRAAAKAGSLVSTAVVAKAARLVAYLVD